MKRAALILVLVLVIVAFGAYFAYTRLADVSSPPIGGTGAPPAGEQGIPSSATEASVEYVHDGDTLFLTDGRKVRLLGINTPEIGENAECYGDEATAELKAMLPEGAHVWVLQDVEPLDQYGRSLLFIYTDSAVNVNLALISSGAAEVEMYAPNLLLRDQLEAGEETARSTGLGLWGACR
jgi:micrococcal nuclease